MQSAQTWARTQLSLKYGIEYRRFYLEEKGDTTGKNSMAQNRAKQRLVNLYFTEYQELYQLGRSKGYPGNMYNKYRKKSSVE